MEFSLTGDALPMDSDTGNLLLPDGSVVAAADVLQFDPGHYRAAVAGAGPGVFQELPSPRIKIRVVGGVEHLLEFANARDAVIALGILQEWQKSSAVA